jgi:tetratricopeptide (TPR) repeat protein
MKSKRIQPNRPEARRVRSWGPVLLIVVVGTCAVLLWRNKFFEPPQAARTNLPERAMPDGQRPAIPPTGAAPASGGGESEVVDRVNRANQLLGQGKPEPAVELLKEAAQLSPEDEDVFYNLGIALSRVGKQEEAMQAYQEALRIFPDYAEVHNNLGNLCLRMGKADEAVKHLEQAVQITPEYAAAWNNLGNALQQLGRAKEAQTHFEKAVELDPEYWQAHFNLGTSYFQQKRLAEARGQFETVLKLQPDFPQAKAALEQLAARESGSTDPKP